MFTSNSIALTARTSNPSAHSIQSCSPVSSLPPCCWTRILGWTHQQEWWSRRALGGARVSIALPRTLTSAPLSPVHRCLAPLLFLCHTSNSSNNSRSSNSRSNSSSRSSNNNNNSRSSSNSRSNSSSSRSYTSSRNSKKLNSSSRRRPGELTTMRKPTRISTSPPLEIPLRLCWAAATWSTSLPPRAPLVSS